VSGFPFVEASLALAVIISNLVTFFALRAIARAQAQMIDLSYKLSKESMNRVLAATDLAAYYTIRDAESPRAPKPELPILMEEI